MGMGIATGPLNYSATIRSRIGHLFPYITRQNLWVNPMEYFLDIRLIFGSLGNEATFAIPAKGICTPLFMEASPSQSKHFQLVK